MLTISANFLRNSYCFMGNKAASSASPASAPVSAPAAKKVFQFVIIISPFFSYNFTDSMFCEILA